MKWQISYARALHTSIVSTASTINRERGAPAVARLRSRFPCFSEFSSEFFVFASRFLGIVPKIRKFCLSLREGCSDSREFDA